MVTEGSRFLSHPQKEPALLTGAESDSRESERIQALACGNAQKGDLDALSPARDARVPIDKNRQKTGGNGDRERVNLQQSVVLTGLPLSFVIQRKAPRRKPSS